MNSEFTELISRYLDDDLSSDELAALQNRLRESPENAQEFARQALLHDRLRIEHQADAAMADAVVPAGIGLHRPQRRSRRLVVVSSLVVIVIAFSAAIWVEVGGTPASAAVVELNRLMAASEQPVDRTFRVTVEDASASDRDKGPSRERDRPPKPPLDGALLSVRGNRQFVLVRKTTEGSPFVTGSNGRTSWAVRPDGPVRVSSDLTRFRHDVPGHEHSMPLNDVRDGLERLVKAYDVTLLPAEQIEGEESPAEEPSRLIIAVKKRGFRGPKRVEITYAVRSGQIRQMRFIDMPYGPERLTLRMTLTEERDLGDAFFDHESHFSLDRAVEFEE